MNADAPLALELVQAVGPLAAAAVALYIAFRSEHRARRERPELRLLYDHESEDFEPDVGPQGVQSHWVRLRVANRWSRRTAEDVEVLVTDVRPHRGRPSLKGFALIWSNVRGPEGRPTTRQTIPPGFARHVDLARIAGPHLEWDSPDLVEGESAASLDLQVEPRPADTRGFLPAGESYVLVALAAKDTDVAYYGVTINFDGKWWAGARAKEHLHVAVTRAHYFELEPEEAWGRMLTRRDRFAIGLEVVRWLNPRNWRAQRAIREARRIYPGRSVQIDENGRITPVDDVLAPDDHGSGPAPP
jgi:hypothetical protein